jgi:hypothetical protein
VRHAAQPNAPIAMSIVGGPQACPRRGQPDGGADQQTGLRSGMTLTRNENKLVRAIVSTVSARQWVCMRLLLKCSSPRLCENPVSKRPSVRRIW